MTHAIVPRKMPLTRSSSDQDLRCGTLNLPLQSLTYHRKRGRLRAGQLPFAPTARADILYRAGTMKPLYS
jgi:hypothetical protein